MSAAAGLASDVAAPTLATSGTETTTKERLLLFVLLSSVFMAAMDVAIVNVAAPSIATGLGASGPALQLVISGYTIAYAVLLVTGARLGQRVGYRTLFLGGLAGFTASSLLCGFAWSAPVLIAARILQGASSAAMAPQVVTLIQLNFAGAVRTRALAWWAAVISVGVVAGQVAGGALVSADIAGSGWRPVFLVNVPLGIVLLALAGRVLEARSSASTDVRRIDLIGVGLISVGVAFVIVPLTFGRTAEWAPWIWVMFGAGLTFAGLAAVHLERLRRRGGDPVIDLSLLRHRHLALGLATVAGLMVAYGGFLFVATIHLQGHLGYSPAGSGLSFSPYAIGFAATSLTMPRLRTSWVPRLILTGAVLAAGAYALAGVAAEGRQWEHGFEVVVWGVAGAGFGAAYSPVISRALSQVPAARAQDASGMLITVVQLSFALGVATVGSLYLGLASDPSKAFAVAAVVCGGAALGAGVAAALLIGGRIPVRQSK